MTLGSTLKTRREELGWSLRDVERKTDGGISNGYLSLLEGDDVKQPSPRHLHLLAGVLDLNYAELIRLAGYVVPSASDVAAAPGWAFAGLDKLTPDEFRMVQELIKQQVKIFSQARADKKRKVD